MLRVYSRATTEPSLQAGSYGRPSKTASPAVPPGSQRRRLPDRRSRRRAILTFGEFDDKTDAALVEEARAVFDTITFVSE
ncbi:MAG TPA: hypothetical protein VEX42_03415 [Microbacterium sp.]|nr:hypothetical protein [Microbacterium sp.]